MGLPKIDSLTRLVEEFRKLPGIGVRSAERLAFHVLRSDQAAAQSLAQSILDVKRLVKHCSDCYNLTENDPCEICSDSQRDPRQVWVVEQPKDLLALESTGLVRGLYHVLMGHIAPLEGIEPGDLTIDALVSRVRRGTVQEIVLATNPTLEGDGTALYLVSVLKNTGVKITRLARGLAVGSQIEYATAGMLEAAIQGRNPV